MSGYVDLQINGYAGVDFNTDDLPGQSLHECCQTLRRDGVEGILATIITSDVDSMCRRIARLVQLRERDDLARKLIWGLHIEGPFLNPATGYIGAHPVAQARQADAASMQRLLDAGGGLVRLVTLAPEMDHRQSVTRMLSDERICIAAGHTDASRDQLRASIDAGLSLFTHLGNGCPQLLPRHDNIIQRALSLADELWISLIADGAHIPFFVLRNYLAVTGLERVIIVTDAISAAGCGPGRFQLGDRWINVGPDGVPRAEDHSHLVGSGTIMRRMAENLRSELLLTASEVEQLTVTNPRRLFELYPGESSVQSRGSRARQSIEG
ncbi:N-acetylglucosamine-6-phosphate deacetylase [Planctomicrobium piriforme]|uniref:N-acetylglucosamine-6-phosphate deacetylase n=1 Tax=Planctomicrobium piriforme TaxID=1576369 RepID=A0A1I3QEE8_9PLAN|nr:N-acetylglucosamine-6-phosphate deacetylase [Planctomicrobium piriforme]SFJ31741.1 N-acetylglucosamine-6-phosphate deacetylase [Planctomicrobium piriforme]